MPPSRPVHRLEPPSALRRKRALAFVLLAVCGLAAGAGLAHLKPHPPGRHAAPAVAWESGAVVIRPAGDAEGVD